MVGTSDVCFPRLVTRAAPRERTDAGQKRPCRNDLDFSLIEVDLGLAASLVVLTFETLLTLFYRYCKKNSLYIEALESETLWSSSCSM